MKKLILLLLLNLIAFHSNSQAVSRATLMTPPYSWNQRAVPSNPYAISTWASFVNIIDDGTPWFTKGNALATNTAVMGSTDNRSLNFITNNIQRFKIDSLGIFRIYPPSSTPSLTIGAHDGDIWYDNTPTIGYGLSLYKSRYSGGYMSMKTDSTIFVVDKIVNTGGATDGYWLGTYTANNFNFAVGMTSLGSLPAVSIVTTAVGNGAMLVNPGSNAYTSDADLRIKYGSQPYAFNIGQAGGRMDFGVVTTSGNAFARGRCVIGSTVIPTSATLTVIGDMSVSTTSTLTGKTRIGGTVAPSATLDVTGTMSVSGTSTVNGLRCIGAFSTASTFSAGTTSTLVGATRIGSSTAPSATLDVTGTMSVSSTTTLNGLTCAGALSVTTTFSAGTTSTLTGNVRIGGTAAPNATLDVTGTMSVSSTATIGGGALSLPSFTATAVANAIVMGSATLNFPSTIAGAVSDLTVTVVGARDGDVVMVGPANGAVTATATYWGWVSATDVVTVRFSPKATEDPASGTFKVTVSKN